MTQGTGVIQYKSKSDYLAKRPGAPKVVPTKEAPVKVPESVPEAGAAKSQISDKAKDVAKKVGDVAAKLPPTPPLSMLPDIIPDIVPDIEETPEIEEPVEEKPVEESKPQVRVNDTPAILFIKGFSLSSSSGDGLEDMAWAIPNSEVYSWSEKDEAIASILERPRTQPVVIVGHSLGGDTAVEIAQELNQIEHGFRKVDMLVTLDSVGFDNDIIPQNVKLNMNFIGDDWYGINDSPNIARNTDYSEVINELREDGHRGIENNEEVQLKIFERLDAVLKGAVAQKTASNLALAAHKDLKGISLN